MANSNTIEEFLVGLGVKVDVKEFFVAVENMGKAVGKFMLGLEGLITGLKAALIKTAEALENLYYVAQRANTTVTNLRELQYGMSQIGLSSEDASQALESLAMAMRINPGNEGLLRHLGIQTREVGGGMRDTTKVMGDFIGRLSKMPFYVATQYAEMFGINARTLTMLLANFGELQAKEAEWRDMAKRTGVDLQDSAKKSHEFMSSLRAIGEVIELMWIKVSTVLISRLQPEMDKFRAFLLAHAAEIENYAIQVGNAILNISDDIISTLPQIDSLIKSSVGWKVVLEAIADIIAYRIFGPLGAAAMLLYQLSGWLNKQEKDHPGPAKNPDGSVNKADPGTKEFFKDNDSMMDSFRQFLYHWVPPLSPDYKKPDSWQFPWPQMLPAMPDTRGGLPATPGAYHPSNDQNPNYNIQGAVPNELFNKLEAAYKLPGGLLDSVWNTESSRGRRMMSSAGAEGHFQFMPDTARQYHVDNPNDLNQSANGAAQYFRDLLVHFGGDVKKSLAGYNWGQRNVDQDVARNGLDWMRHLPKETGDYIAKVLKGTSQMTALAPVAPASQQAPNVTLHQKTDITVHGSEGHSTGKAVVRQQEAINSSIVRQFRTAIVA